MAESMHQDLSDMPDRLRKYLDVPARALGHSRREQLGQYLNPRRQDISESGLLKDWRGLAERLGFNSLEIDNFDLNRYPTAEMLSVWQKRAEAQIGHLLVALCAMERIDILENDQLITLIETDIINYLEQEAKKRQQEQNPVQDPHVQSSDAMEVDEYSQITINESIKLLYLNLCNPNERLATEALNDHIKYFPGMPEYFDAYICYVSADFEFVQQMMAKLEGQHGLKLCVPNRDLVAGVAEYTIKTRLIKERCRKVIIVLSPEYRLDDECDFITKYAVTLAPGAREKKLIPVVYKQPCTIPDILSPICLLDYTRCDVVDWFWERLAKSLKMESRALPANPQRARQGPHTAPVVHAPRTYRPTPVPNHTAPVRRTTGDQLVLPDEPQGAAGGSAPSSDPVYVNAEFQHFGMNSGAQAKVTAPSAPRKK